MAEKEHTDHELDLKALDTPKRDRAKALIAARPHAKVAAEKWLELRTMEFKLVTLS